MAVNSDVFITDVMKSVGAVLSFLGGVLGFGANSLAQQSKLFSIEMFHVLDSWG